MVVKLTDEEYNETMTNKRMFSRDIVRSDAFLDMPPSTQALYFHLGMEADDDGFVGNAKQVQKLVGVNDDDVRLLEAKRFIIKFASGVLVVKHHRINNKWDSYNNRRTMYVEEFSQLRIKENRAYTLDEMQGIPAQTGFSLKPVFRREEKRREERKEIAKAISPLSEVKEVREDSEGNTKSLKKRDSTVMNLREKFYGGMEKLTGIRPVSNQGDYVRIKKALEYMKEREVTEMFEVAVAIGKIKTVREAFTDRAIDLKRQELV